MSQIWVNSSISPTPASRVEPTSFQPKKSQGLGVRRHPAARTSLSVRLLLNKVVGVILAEGPHRVTHDGGIFESAYRRAPGQVEDRPELPDVVAGADLDKTSNVPSVRSLYTSRKPDST